MIKNEVARNIVHGGARAAAAVALGGAICWGMYELEQSVADDHAGRVEDCASYDTTAAAERCITDADALRGVIGFVEGGVVLATAATAAGIAGHGVRQAFGYSRSNC